MQSDSSGRSMVPMPRNWVHEAPRAIPPRAGGEPMPPQSSGKAEQASLHSPSVGEVKKPNLQMPLCAASACALQVILIMSQTSRQTPNFPSLAAAAVLSELLRPMSRQTKLKDSLMSHISVAFRVLHW